MNTQERKKIIEKVGFKIKNNKIIDETTKEQLKIYEQDRFFAKKYKSEKAEIYIKSTNFITIKRKNMIIEIKETQEEQIIKIKNKNDKIIITTTIEGMMYKIGSINIVGIINNEIIKKEYTQRIEKAEINKTILNLQEITPKKITELLTKNIKAEKIELIKALIEENTKKILEKFNENIDKYIRSLNKENEKEKIKTLEKYKKKNII